jgi:hypothetical protein
MLHNVSAIDYGTSVPVIPYHATNQTIDTNLLLPFGCLIIVHRDKDQVNDGKLDPRGLYGVFIGLADRYDFKKGIKVILPGDVIIETCFFTSDTTYYPWRPVGQRRLLRDGTFGKELETSSIFKGEVDFDERILISKKVLKELDAHDFPDDGDEPMATPGDEPTILPTVTDATSCANDGAASSASDTSHTPINMDLKLLDKKLEPGDRIIFVFNPPHNDCYGVYINPGLRRSDRLNDLCRVHWDDGGDELAQLSDARRFKGRNLNDIDTGQWAIVAFETSVLEATSHIFAAHAQVENNIFTRDFHDIPDGDLFIPSHNIDDANHGPFTEAQVMKQDAWPEWKAAANSEINQIADRDVFELVDENTIKKQGFFIYPSRFVYTVSSKGSRKGRLVVRGDYQVFGDSNADTSDDKVEYYENYDVESHAASHGVETDFIDEHLITSKKSRKVSVVDSKPEAVSGAPSITGPTSVKAKSDDAKLLSRLRDTGRKLYSPVVIRAANMSIVALAVVKKMLIFIADVKGAFLYAELFEDEWVFVRPPKGWSDHPKFKGKIMKLKKALYGLRQAPRRWYTCLHDALAKSGLTRSLKDPCVMYLRKDGFEINVGTHVDDLLFATSDKTKFETWFKTLTFTFGTAVWLSTEVTKYVSLDFTYDYAKQFLQISQRRYILKALEMLGYDNKEFKSISTPMEVGTKHHKEDMPKVVNKELRQLAQRNLGIAGWICQMTMPEALYAWSYLAQYASNPNAAVLKDVKRLFRYMKWTLENDVEGLVFTPLKNTHVPHIGTVLNNQLYGFVDSTHISEERSVSRYGLCIFMSGMLLVAISKKLTYVTLSSTESEYVGMSEALKYIMFLIELFEELGEKQGPVPLGNDNSGAIAIAENKGCNAGRVRHIQARVHWIQDIVDANVIVMKKIPTKDMPADNLTKALSYEAHARHAEYQKGKKFPKH